MSSPIQGGINAVSCSCQSITFDGKWDINVTHLNQSGGNASQQGNCFNLQCANVSSGFIAAKSLVCNGTDVILHTYGVNVTIHVNVSCVTTLITISPGRIYSRPVMSPLALSFLETNFNLIGNNSFAVVTNDYGVTVGQIQSDMIQVVTDNFTDSPILVTLQMCILIDESIDASQYEVYDLGVTYDNGIEIHPMGITNDESTSSMEIMCFAPVTVTERVTSYILIKRHANYESSTPYSDVDEDIVLTSAYLFCIGGVLVMVFHCFLPFNLAVFSAGVQSVVLLLFRGIYFFVLVSQDIAIGGLVDFILIEIPTFIYIGIFLQIILVAYWLFFLSEKVSTNTLFASVLLALLINWIIFAAIVIAISLTDSTAVEEKTCDCLISSSVKVNSVAKVIRIVYKSVVLFIAVMVVLLTVMFGWRHKRQGINMEYYQVLGFSLGLLCDCIAFLIYYSLNTPAGGFVIVLWFTELFPICAVNATLAWRYIRHAVISMIQRLRVFGHGA